MASNLQSRRRTGIGLGFLLVGIAVGTALPSGPEAARAPRLTPGDHTFELNHQGRTRTYLVHVPPQAQRGEPLPVILNFHGGGGTAAGSKTYTQMDPLADREGFLAVYPNGTGRFEKRLLTWNAGTCCGSAAVHKVDDVGFVLRLLDHLAARSSIDRNRVYATGLSNGGMFAYRLAVDASDRIAAIAPVAGGMVVDKFEPSRPVPVLHIHSVDDPRALYQGGLGPPFPMTKHRVLHPNIDEMLARWVAQNRCPAEPRAEVELRGQAGTPEQAHTATKYVFAPCQSGAEVVLWKLTGAGHVWPGGVRNFAPRLLGPSTTIIDANQEMWQFFSRYSLRGRREEAKPKASSP